MRETPLGELETDGRADGNWHREWAHRCKDMRQEETQSVQVTAGLPGCPGCSLGSTEAKQEDMGLGLGEKIGLQGAVFNNKELEFHLASNKKC